MDDTETITIVTTEGQVTQYTLSISGTAGGTSQPAAGSHIYNENTLVPVTAIPDDNYHLDHWVLDGVDSGSNETISVLMDADHTLSAIFQQNLPAGNTALTGTVVNQYFPMPFIALNINDANNTLVANPKTSIKGIFETTLPYGTYTIKIINPAITDFSTTIILNQPEVTFDISLILKTWALIALAAGATSPIWLYLYIDSQKKNKFIKG